MENAFDFPPAFSGMRVRLRDTFHQPSSYPPRHPILLPIQSPTPHLALFKLHLVLVTPVRVEAYCIQVLPKFREMAEAESSGSSDAASKAASSKPSGSGIWNTPVAYTENSSQRFGFDRKLAHSHYERLGREVLSTVLGPMPVDSFLDAFLSRATIDKDGMPETTAAFASLDAVIKEKRAQRREPTEKDLYEPLVNALNSEARCPGFLFRMTSEKSDESGGKVGSKKPDVLLYAKDHVSLADLQRKTSRADMGFAASYVEVKRQAYMDPFQDPPEGEGRATWQFLLGKRANGREIHDNSDAYLNLLETLGQTVAYAVEICARQHRVFCFSILIFRTRARLIRFDRAGIIVSESFDLIAHPEFLCQFLWCFSKLSDEQRGYDCSVEPATRAGEALFRRSIEAHIRAQLLCDTDSDTLWKCLQTHYTPGFVTVITLDPMPLGTSISKPRKLLVSRPICTPLSPSGRCTRAYWAVQVPSGKSSKDAIPEVVFLKDTWRFAGTSANGNDSIPPEGATLHDLHSRGVRNIPQVLDHGDVLEETQKTITQTYLNAHWVSKGGRMESARVVARIHYRLLLDIAGFDLLQISGTHELLHGTYDAFQALRDAYERARYIHRDVYPGNIILYRQREDGATGAHPARRGYLIDWDYACSLDKDAGEFELSGYGPSLQWQFLSADIGSQVKKTHEIVDDMESMLYVVIYCGLLRLPSGVSENKGGLVGLLHNLFDATVQQLNNVVTIGHGKLANKHARTYTKTIKWESKEMETWVDTVCDFLSPTVDTPEDRRGRWTLAALEEFWKAFLDEHPDLPRGDSVNHLALDKVYYSRVAPPTTMGTSNQPTIAVGTKRSVPSPNTGKEAKRQRQSAGNRTGETGLVSHTSPNLLLAIIGKLKHGRRLPSLRACCRERRPIRWMNA
ncbi:hypothetical protein C8Q70DRAFT_432869 [Cubamyces menziesii]|nr:hypothetical protein C8Q70DRAFT_432869 [Cubamyces menziesii]